jgi:hypothetical protein
MHSKAVLTRADVLLILDAARTRAQENQWSVTIAVVDDGGPNRMLRLPRPVLRPWNLDSPSGRCSVTHLWRHSRE